MIRKPQKLQVAFDDGCIRHLKGRELMPAVYRVAESHHCKVEGCLALCHSYIKVHGEWADRCVCNNLIIVTSIERPGTKKD